MIKNLIGTALIGLCMIFVSVSSYGHQSTVCSGLGI